MKKAIKIALIILAALILMITVFKVTYIGDGRIDDGTYEITGFDQYPDAYIVVAGEQDNLPGAAPPCFGKGRRSDLCDLTVDYRGELIDHSPFQTLANEAGQSGAELFSVAQDRERSQPCGDIA